MSIIKRPKQQPVIEKENIFVAIDSELATALMQYTTATESWLQTQSPGTEIEPITIALEKRIKDVVLKYATEFQEETGESYPMELRDFLQKNQKPKRLTPTQKKLKTLEEKESAVQKAMTSLRLKEQTVEVEKKLSAKQNALYRLQQQKAKLQPQ